MALKRVLAAHTQSPQLFKVIKTVLIDLSGTLHIEDTVIPGTVEALKKLRNLDVEIKFVTNTTKESTRLVHNRLVKLGFDIERQEITSSLGAAKALVDREKLSPFLLVAGDALEEFDSIKMTNKPDSVLIGLAPEEFHYTKLNEAFRHLQQGARLIAIHAGKYYKTKEGMSLGPGCFVKGLEYAAQCTSEVVGKPSPLFFKTVLGDCKAEDAVMIGDDVTDDIVGAQNVGIRGILVKTGKYRPNDEQKMIADLPGGVYNSFVEAVDEIARIKQGL